MVDAVGSCAAIEAVCAEWLGSTLQVDGVGGGVFECGPEGVIRLSSFDETTVTWSLDIDTRSLCIARVRA